MWIKFGFIDKCEEFQYKLPVVLQALKHTKKFYITKHNTHFPKETNFTLTALNHYYNINRNNVYGKRSNNIKVRYMEQVEGY